jgi:hypothetical protein
MSYIPLSKKPAWDKFWSKVDRRGPDECWPWLAQRNCGGYGYVTWEKRTQTAQRVAWLTTNGPIPEGDGYHGTCVLHRCDNRVCCNPAHLFLGSHADNMADMRDKKRRKGIGKHEANGRAKLTPQQVEEIRAHAFGKVRLARMYGVSSSQIQRIRAGKQWLPSAESFPDRVDVASAPE